MIEKVRCVYRIQERAEMLQGSFDTISGTICEIPDKFHLDLATNYYSYADGNYVNYHKTSYAELFTLMCKNTGALAVIDYNNIGAIIVRRDSHALYLFKKQLYIMVKKFPSCQFDFKTEDIGIMKTPLLTYDTMQNLAHIIIDLSGEIPIVHTRYGKVPIEVRYDKTKKHNMSRFLELCNNEKAYGSIEYNSEVKFIGIVNGKLKMIGEN